MSRRKSLHLDFNLLTIAPSGYQGGCRGLQPRKRISERDIASAICSFNKVRSFSNATTSAQLRHLASSARIRRPSAI